MNLYPLKFKPILKEKIWGGNALARYGKDLEGKTNIGESWELSAYGDDVSIVTNGYLADNDINDLVETYMGDLVGERIYQRYGNLFPLLFKFIAAEDDLSVQVHPNDDIAWERHRSLGKSEMWYVLDAAPDARLILGFQNDTSADDFRQHLEEHQLASLLQSVPVQKGDVAFLPAGLVHSLGKGIVVAEIQQTSDLTYRIYDYERLDDAGNPRELHLAEAIHAMQYKAHTHPLLRYTAKENTVTSLANCEQFTTNLLTFNQPIERDYMPLDCFVVYMCVEGSVNIVTDDNLTPLSLGETVLIPASIGDVRLIPTSSSVRLLEVYM